MLICNNDTYSPETMTFATVEAFLAYCRQALGEVPALTHEAGNSRWVDEDGETALVEIEDAALVAAFEADGAEQGASDFVSRSNDVASGQERPSWVTNDESDDEDEDVELDAILAGMDERARIKAAEGSEEVFLSSVGRPQIEALEAIGISAPALWEIEIDGVELGERWSNAFIAAWAKAAKRD